MTTCKNNFFFHGGQPSADIETVRLRLDVKVVFTSCSSCFHSYLLVMQGQNPC
ncbi:MAG: hypothetical protein IKR48_03065 [Kiritimatiellae bacterium]|nr:hypothetical protein [Kiritimatiellia bacterium]